MFLKILYIASLLGGLFIFYKLVKDDIKLISLKITENTIFDIFLFTTLFSIVGGRLMYVISHPGAFALTPLNFILIPYYPGFSLVGAVALAFGSLFLLLKKKRIMKLRIFDLATLSMLPIFIIGFLGKLEAFVFIILSAFLISIYRNPIAFSRLNFQGAILAIFLLVYSFVEFLSILIRTRELLTPELILAIIIFIFASFLITRGFVRGYI